MAVYARPGADGSLMTFLSRYDDYIGGEWVAPAACRYFENASWVAGQPFCEVPRTDEADIENAPDARHAAAPRVGQHVAGRAGGDSEQDRRPHRLPGSCAPGAHVSPEQVRTHGVDYESVDDDRPEKR
jgi:hypothetical protein